MTATILIQKENHQERIEGQFQKHTVSSWVLILWPCNPLFESHPPKTPRLLYGKGGCYSQEMETKGRCGKRDANYVLI